jgi:hypothetical protein
MIDNLFKIESDKFNSMVLSENALQFSSKEFETNQAFSEAWNKTISLASKLEIKYDAIKIIKQEDNSDQLGIDYKGAAGIPMNVVFSFADGLDHEAFVDYFITKQYFQKSTEGMTPFGAVKGDLLWMLGTIAFTIFAYYQALEITAGTATEGSTGKTRMFNALIEFLGAKGVIALGAAIALFFAYKTWARYKNPPLQTSLFPPNR